MEGEVGLAMAQVMDGVWKMIDWAKPGRDSGLRRSLYLWRNRVLVGCDQILFAILLKQ